MDTPQPEAVTTMGFVAASDGVKALVEDVYRRHARRGRTCAHPDQATLICGVHSRLRRCHRCAAQHLRDHSLKVATSCQSCGGVGVEVSRVVFGVSGTGHSVVALLCPSCRGEDDPPPGLVA